MPNWQEENNWLTKTFKFDDFVQAAKFIAQIVPLAEEADHHPDLELHDYNQVTVKLQTHSKHQVTDQDHQLAQAIDQLDQVQAG
jgi:4a-hydroxytetrahydrobiopterin dehydratase